MSDLIQRLAEIREQAGYDALPDPSKIQGFDDSEPPPPEFPVRPPVNLDEVPDGPPDFDDEVFQEESPLIPKAPEILENSHRTIESVPMPSLAVAVYGEKRVASFLGREVELTAAEEAAVRQVVVRAIEREMRAQLAALQGLLPKRKRRASSQRATKAPKGYTVKSIRDADGTKVVAGASSGESGPSQTERKARAKDGTSEGLQPTLEPPALPQVPKRRGRPPKQRLDGAVR